MPLGEHSSQCPPHRVGDNTLLQASVLPARALDTRDPPTGKQGQAQGLSSGASPSAIPLIIFCGPPLHPGLGKRVLGLGWARGMLWPGSRRGREEAPLRHSAWLPTRQRVGRVGRGWEGTGV